MSYGLITKEQKQICGDCSKEKLCGLYVLPNGYAVFVCRECRGNLR